MKKEDIILIGESNDEHFELIRNHLLQPEANSIIRFTDGQNILNFLLEKINKSGENHLGGYVLVMDINIPTVDGVEILEKIKTDGKLKRLPVVILTAKDDQNIIERCHELGCSMYVVKPVEDKHTFAETVRKIGSFLSIVKLAPINN